MSGSGAAIGVLSGLQILPAAGSNGVGELRKELAYMHSHNPSFAGIALVEGTEPFNPDLAGGDSRRLAEE